MGRIGSFGGGLVVALVLGVVAHAAAAAPEFGVCRAAAGGGYTNSSCTHHVKPASSGKYEWYAGPGGRGIQASRVVVTAAHVLFDDPVKCNEGHGVGEYSGPEAVSNVQYEFTGCEMSGLKCSTAGYPAGVLVTSLLEGSLAFERATTKPVLDLFPPEPTTPFMTYECGTEAMNDKFVVTGSVAARLSPSDRMGSKTLLSYAGRNGHQTPEELEGGGIAKLEVSENDKPPEGADLQGKFTLSSEEGIELNRFV